MQFIPLDAVLLRVHEIALQGRHSFK